MGENRYYQALDVIGYHKASTANQSQSLRGVIQSETAPRAYAQVQDLGIASRPHYADQVVNQRIFDRDLAHLALERQNVVAVHYRAYLLDPRIELVPAQDILFIFGIGISHSDSHHEPVQLRLR